MIEVIILISFVWVCGFLYTCGVHYNMKDEVRSSDVSEEDKAIVDKGGWLQYVGLFFGWPHYLGYMRGN